MSDKDVVGVRFQRAGRVYYYNAAGIELKVNDNVVVETDHGLSVGRVVIAPRQVISSDLPQPLRTVVRKASDEDLQQWKEASGREEGALAKCKELVARLGLSMKPLRVESNLEGNYLTILFVAEEKVDFRQLARELAIALRARVELHQIGARDASKLLGGLGKCGCPFCCATFLTDFNPLSIKMAKEQNLSLDPTKISGNCGRLLCCLAYENELYHVMRQRLPRIGQRVTTPSGEADVVGVNPLKETVTVRPEGGAALEVPLAEVTFTPGPGEKKVGDGKRK